MAKKASFDWTEARKALLILAIPAAILATCAIEAGDQRSRPKPQTMSDSGLTVRAERIVKNNLRDDSGVRFRNTFLTASKAYCGEVNAKNALGGYTGYQRFIVLRPGTLMIEEAYAAYDFNENWSVHCL